MRSLRSCCPFVILLVSFERFNGAFNGNSVPFDAVQVGVARHVLGAERVAVDTARPLGQSFVFGHESPFGIIVSAHRLAASDSAASRMRGHVWLRLACNSSSESVAITLRICLGSSSQPSILGPLTALAPRASCARRCT